MKLFEKSPFEGTWSISAYFVQETMQPYISRSTLRIFLKLGASVGVLRREKCHILRRPFFRKSPCGVNGQFRPNFGQKLRKLVQKDFFEFLYHEIEQRVDKKVTTEISKKVFHLGQIHHFRWFWPNIMEI